MPLAPFSVPSLTRRLKGSVCTPCWREGSITTVAGFQTAMCEIVFWHQTAREGAGWGRGASFTEHGQGPRGLSTEVAFEFSSLCLQRVPGYLATYPSSYGSISSHTPPPNLSGQTPPSFVQRGFGSAQNAGPAPRGICVQSIIKASQDLELGEIGVF